MVPSGIVSGSPTSQLPSRGDVLESGWDKEAEVCACLHGPSA